MAKPLIYISLSLLTSLTSHARLPLPSPRQEMSAHGHRLQVLCVFPLSFFYFFAYHIKTLLECLRNPVISRIPSRRPWVLFIRAEDQRCYTSARAESLHSLILPAAVVHLGIAIIKSAAAKPPLHTPAEQGIRRTLCSPVAPRWLTPPDGFPNN